MKLSTLTLSRMKDRPLQRVVELVQLASRFHSRILIKCNDEIADLRHSSVLTIVALCVMASTVVELEVTGDDEQDAARSVEELFLG